MESEVVLERQNSYEETHSDIEEWGRKLQQIVEAVALDFSWIDPTVF